MLSLEMLTSVINFIVENKFFDSDIVLSLSQSVHKIQVGIFSGYTLVHRYLEETNILTNLFI